MWTKSLAQESFSSTSRLCIESVFAASKNEVVNGGPDDASYLMMLVIYIADGCGDATTGGENITVEDAGGNEQTLQCTLAPFSKCLTFSISQEPNSSVCKRFQQVCINMVL